MNFSPSDIRWKTNVITLDNSLQKVTKLRGVSYEWKIKEFPDKKFDKGKQLGFIAQEVEKVIPELVREDEKSYKNVDYNKISPLLVEAIKEQQKMIEDQKIVIEKLQKENATLRSEFNALKINVEKMMMEKTTKLSKPDAASTSNKKFSDQSK